VTTIPSDQIWQFYQTKTMRSIAPSLIAIAYCAMIMQLFSFPCLVRAEAQQPLHVVQLTAAGSGVNLAITRLLANSFTKLHPNIAIEVPGSIGTNGAIKAVLTWVVKFVRHAMRLSELINPVAFVQMLPGRCTPVQLAAAACCKKFQYIP